MLQIGFFFIIYAYKYYPFIGFYLSLLFPDTYLEVGEQIVL